MEACAHFFFVVVADHRGDHQKHQATSWLQQQHSGPHRGKSRDYHATSSSWSKERCPGGRGASGIPARAQPHFAGRRLGAGHLRERSPPRRLAAAVCHCHHHWGWVSRQGAHCAAPQARDCASRPRVADRDCVLHTPHLWLAVLCRRTPSTHTSAQIVFVSLEWPSRANTIVTTLCSGAMGWRCAHHAPPSANLRACAGMGCPSTEASKPGSRWPRWIGLPTVL